MDLGIRGRTTIVCAASLAGAGALAREGVNLVINARSEAALATLADDLRREMGVGVRVAADITSEEGRRAVLSPTPNPDILINNASGPPPGDFREVKREDWISAVDANMLTPIFLIRATIDGTMPGEAPGHNESAPPQAADIEADVAGGPRRANFGLPHRHKRRTGVDHARALFVPALVRKKFTLKAATATTKRRMWS